MPASDPPRIADAVLTPGLKGRVQAWLGLQPAPLQAGPSTPGDLRGAAPPLPLGMRAGVSPAPAPGGAASDEGAASTARPQVPALRAGSTYAPAAPPPAVVLQISDPQAPVPRIAPTPKPPLAVPPAPEAPVTDPPSPALQLRTEPGRPPARVAWPALRLPAAPPLPPLDGGAPLADAHHVRRIWAHQARAGRPRSPERLLRLLLGALGAAGAAATARARGAAHEAAVWSERAERALRQAQAERGAPPREEREGLAIAPAPDRTDPLALRAAARAALAALGGDPDAVLDPWLQEQAHRTATAGVRALRRRLAWSATLSVLLPVAIVAMARLPSCGH